MKTATPLSKTIISIKLGKQTELQRDEPEKSEISEKSELFVLCTGQDLYCSVKPYQHLTNRARAVRIEEAQNVGNAGNAIDGGV